MTAVLPRPAAQPRRPAGDGKGRGGQFAPKFASTACPATYALLDRLAPASPPEDELPPGWHRDPANPFRVLLPAPPKCPHGHFARWAASNCCRPGGPPPATTGAAATTAAQCTGTTTSGTRCTRTTTRTFHGRTACHHHGGTQ